MAVAASPNGTRVYVANASSNTLNVINTATNTIIATVDLSSAGASPSQNGAFFSFSVAHVWPQAVPVMVCSLTVRVKFTRPPGVSGAPT